MFSRTNRLFFTPEKIGLTYNNYLFLYSAICMANYIVVFSLFMSRYLMVLKMVIFTFHNELYNKPFNDNR